MGRTYVSGRKVDRRVLAMNVDAELGLTTCVWDRTGQMARLSTPERSGKGFVLIPVGSASETISGVGEAAGGVSEAHGFVSEVASEYKIEGNGVEGTFNKDMTNDGMIFEAHKRIVKPLSQS